MTRMQRIVALLVVTLVGFSTLAGLAEPSARCVVGAARCATPSDAKAKGNTTSASAKTVPMKAPTVGKTAQGGRAPRGAELRKLGKPAAGRSYRILDDRVVLVESGSGKVLKVLGPASDLLR